MWVADPEDICYATGHLRLHLLAPMRAQKWLNEGVGNTVQVRRVHIITVQLVVTGLQHNNVL